MSCDAATCWRAIEAAIGAYGEPDSSASGGRAASPSDSGTKTLSTLAARSAAPPSAPCRPVAAPRVPRTAPAVADQAVVVGVDDAPVAVAEDHARDAVAEADLREAVVELPAAPRLAMPRSRSVTGAERDRHADVVDQAGLLARVARSRASSTFELERVLEEQAEQHDRDEAERGRTRSASGAFFGGRGPRFGLHRQGESAPLGPLFAPMRPGGALAVSLDRERVARRLRRRPRGCGSGGGASSEVVPLARRSTASVWRPSLRVLAEERRKPTWMWSCVIAHREACSRPSVEQRDDLARAPSCPGASSGGARPARSRRPRPGGRDRDAVDRGDVDRVAGGVVRDVARRGEIAVAALQRADGRAACPTRRGRRAGEHAAVDLAGADVLVAALVDVDPRSERTRFASSGFGRSMISPIEKSPSP